MGTLQDTDSWITDTPAGEEMIFPAGRTGLLTRCSSVARRDQGRGAVVAEPSAITDSSHAYWADGVHVPFVQCEVSTTKVARGALGLAWCATRRAADYSCIVGFWSLDLQNGATQTSKTRSLGQLAGIELPFAFRTGDE